MNEYETLGKLVYEAYQKTWLERVINWPGMYRAWDGLDQGDRDAWIAAAKAVAERVIAELQTAEEASE